MIKRSRRALLKILLASPLVFLIKLKTAFHFQYVISMPEKLSKNSYLTQLKLKNQRKIVEITQMLIKKNHILKISEHWFSNKVKVNVIFNSKNGSKLWQAIMEDPKTFNRKSLNNLDFKINYITKV